MVHPLLGYVHKDLASLLFYLGFLQNMALRALHLQSYNHEKVQEPL
jgi:hypothetical protein